MKKSLLTLFLLFAMLHGFAQVGVGTDNPNQSSALDVESTTKGFLPPRLTQVQLLAITSPAEGLLVYCTDCSTKGIYVFDGNNFIHSPSGAAIGISSSAVLTQIGNEADNPDTVNSVVTATQLNAITPPITGVIAANQTAYQDYIDANPDLFANPATQAEVQAMVTAVNAADPTYCTGSATTVVDVVGAGGATWMDRNLGATQQATSSTDADAYGDLYQWGRFTDGHQCRTSSTISTNSATDTPGHGDFILEPSSPYDWRSPQNDNLWQGVSGTNNPCPSGYRLPTETELDTERTNWGSNNAAGAFASPLKLPVAGYRRSSSGTLGDGGSRGYYWSSTVSGTSARYLHFNSSDANMYSSNRAFGFSVRCIKD